MSSPAAVLLIVLLLNLALGLGPALAQPSPAKRPSQLAPMPEDAVVPEPGYLGIVADDRLDMDRGIRVIEALAGAPAAQGGLQEGDLIVRIDGAEVKTLADMAALLQHAKVDQEVKFEVERDGQLIELTVKLGHRPPPEQRRFQNFGPIPPEPTGDAAAAPRRRLLGMTTVALDEALRGALAVPVTHGAVVTRVESRSPAAEAQIPIDAVVVAVDGNPVTGPADLARFVAQAGAGKTLEIDYFVRGQRETTRVTLKDYQSGPGGGQAMPGPFGFGGGTGPSGPIMPPDQRVLQLEARIADLEARIEQLERQIQATTGSR